jgi:hypothetical protein
MIIDELDDIKCEECYRLAIEDIAAFAIDPENLTRLDPDDAEEMRRYLGKLLGRPNASPSLSSGGKKARRDLPAIEVGCTSRLPCCTATASFISLEKLG